MIMALLWISLLIGSPEASFSFVSPRPFCSTTKQSHAVLTTKRTTPQHAALPSCTATHVGTTIIIAGVTGVGAQLGLQSVLQHFRVKSSAFKAHSMVALSLVSLLSWYGSIAWWGMTAPSTAVYRLLHPNASARWMGATVVGAMGLWDVPTTLLVKELRKPDVIIHHLMMTLVALTGAVYLPTYYAFFYLGVCELSSIPLVLLDLLEDRGGKHAKTIKAVLVPITALSFSIVRAYYFTKVTLWNFIPDILAVFSSGVGSILSRRAMQFLFVSSIGFTILQLYWFYTQILRVILGKQKTRDEGNHF